MWGCFSNKFGKKRLKMTKAGYACQSFTVKVKAVYYIKGQLQRFYKLSLFDRFRHVENGLDINFLKFIFVFLLSAVKVLKWQLGWLFRKKNGKICALVPQKARAWAVTSLEININSYCWRKILYISCMQDSSEAWWSMRMAARYDQDQKEPFLIMKKVLKVIKRVYAKQLTRNYKPTAACID